MNHMRSKPSLLLFLCCQWVTSFPTPLPGRVRTCSTQLFRTADSKWDNLVDDDDDDTDSVPAWPDMKYIPRNVKRQHQNFVDLRDAGGSEVTHDLYVPQPGTDVFWYVGKVASVSEVSVEQAVARQWALIELHASGLRRLELYPHRGRLEIWMAPGDSEFDVAYNRPQVVFQKMKRDVEGAETIKSNLVGFQGETYESGPGMGFRTYRTPDGRPAKPEILAPTYDETDGGEQYSEAKSQAPTEEDLEKLQTALKDNNMNISQLYDEQQKRNGKAIQSTGE